MTRRPRKIDLNHLIWTLPPPSTGVKVVTRDSVKVTGDGVRVLLGHLRSCLSGCRAGTGSERGSRCGGEQYSSTAAEYRVQSTEYRREGTAAACWSEHQRLQRLEITTRLWSNALVISDSMQIKGGDTKYLLRVIRKFTFDTLWPDQWSMLLQFQKHIQSVSIILVGNEVDVGDVEARISF